MLLVASHRRINLLFADGSSHHLGLALVDVIAVGHWPGEIHMPVQYHLVLTLFRKYFQLCEETRKTVVQREKTLIVSFCSLAADEYHIVT